MARLWTSSRKVVEKWVKKHPSISLVMSRLALRAQQSRKQWAAKCKHELPLAAADVSTLLRVPSSLADAFLPTCASQHLSQVLFCRWLSGLCSLLLGMSFSHLLSVPNNVFLFKICWFIGWCKKVRESMHTSRVEEPRRERERERTSGRLPAKRGA